MKKALIVEDFKPIADIWRLALENELYEHIEITDNTDLVENFINEMDPDLVLMDINLKGSRNGIETVQELIPSYPHLKVLFLSMHGQPHMMEKAMEAGAKGYITKSSPLVELKNAIKAIESDEIYICEQMRMYWNKK